MAITVITPGKLPENDRMQGTCRRCKVHVECLRSDTTPLSDQRDGDATSVFCPTSGCGERIWVVLKPT